MKVLTGKHAKEYESLRMKQEDLQESLQTSKVENLAKIKQLKKEYDVKLEKVELEKHSLELKIESLTADNKALEKLRNDKVATKTTLLELDEREAQLKTREANCKKAEEAQELEDSKKYKSGYEDGVADGLRRGYELTADDRQNMASIAALAAASHSDGATQKIAESIVIGMEKTRASKQLTAGSKKKS